MSSRDRVFGVLRVSSVVTYLNVVKGFRLVTDVGTVSLQPSISLSQ